MAQGQKIGLAYRNSASNVVEYGRTSMLRDSAPVEMRMTIVRQATSLEVAFFLPKIGIPVRVRQGFRLGSDRRGGDAMAASGGGGTWTGVA